jgi:ATP-dependent Zn protease
VNRGRVAIFVIFLLGGSYVYSFQLFSLLNKMNQQARSFILPQFNDASQEVEVSQDYSSDNQKNNSQRNTPPRRDDSNGGGWDTSQKRSPSGLPGQQPPNDPSRVFFRDIVGIEAVLVEVTEIVDYLRYSEVYRRLGARMPRGILLEGPPGNGKTMIAKAIANEANCHFVHASGSSFIEMYVGVGAARVRELFAQARARRPAILFIDEFDAVAGVHRSALTGGGGDQEAKQTINQLLTELDGFSTDDSVIVIAATNDAQSLDPAVKRSGRFDRLIHVPLPDEAGRKKLLFHYLEKLPRLGDDITEELQASIAKESEGLCAADFKNMVNEMAIFAVRDRSDAVFAQHVMAGAWKVISQRKAPGTKGDFKDLFKKK